MGNLWCCRSRRVVPSANSTLGILLLGLGGSGKTSLAQAMLKIRPTAPPKPTAGCQVFPLRMQNHHVEVTEVGGREDVRPLWRHYFLDALGIIFVVDGSKWQKLPEAREILLQLMENELLQTKPLLLLVNKQDRPEAVDHLDIIDFFSLSDLANAFKTPTLAISVSALDEGKTLSEGFNWLVATVIENYVALTKRNQILKEIVNQQQQNPRKGRSLFRTLSARVRRKKRSLGRKLTRKRPKTAPQS